jgi:hypothetical protein
MRTITVNFAQRLRLMQIVGGYPAAGLPALKACLALLERLEFNAAEASVIGFDKDVVADRLTWNPEAVATLRPQYEITLAQDDAKLLASIIEKHSNFQPSIDGFIPGLLAQLSEAA